ncbi:MAG: zf-TFIIB domain-containing protein [Myxococcales bacterium]|nr:zf-TFIIB domain-containing protein [Myxococcales bacterium]
MARRPEPTAASRARAARIAEALKGMLDDVPVEQRADAASDPYRPRPPPRAESTAVNLRCPACGVAMTTDFDRGVELDRCLGCGGLWLDVGELDVVSAAPATAPVHNVAALRREMQAHTVHMNQGPVRYRTCPRCGGVMNRRNFGTLSGVIIDECPRHGVFLDPEELEAIERFVELGGMELQRRGEAERRARLEERAAALESRHAAIAETARHWVWWGVFDWWS